MSASTLRTLSKAVLVIGLAIVVVTGVGAIIGNAGALVSAMTIVGGINSTVFLFAVVWGLSYLVGKSSGQGTSIVTVLRSLIGVQIFLTLVQTGLRIVEYGTDTLYEVGAFLWPLFVTVVFVIVLFVLSKEIAKQT